MKGQTIRLAGLTFVVAAVLLLPMAREASGRMGTQGLGFQGLGFQGLGRQGLGFQGLGFQGLGFQGLGFQGLGFQGLGFQGLGFQGLGRQGLGRQGLGFQGLGLQGLGLQGLGFQGLGRQGLGRQGLGFQGLGFQGLGRQGLGLQGLGFQGLGFQGLGRQGLGLQGTALRGIDRLGVVLADVRVGEVKLAEEQLVNGLDAQWLQTGAELETVSTVSPEDDQLPVQLQAAWDDPTDGSFICIQDEEGGPCRQNVAGTFWVLTLESVAESEEVTEGEEAEETSGIILYIADVTQDSTLNQSKYPDNSDIYLYTVYYRHPATAQWQSLCPEDIYGQPHAMAIPVDPFDRSPEARKHFTFACTAGGVAAKCARIWGYKPWLTVSEEVWNGTDFVQETIALKDFYDTCLVAARADYCQDGSSFTREGTTVDLFDTLDGVSSLVPTAGLGYEPGSPQLMLHEEYQISEGSSMTIAQRRDASGRTRQPPHLLRGSGPTVENGQVRGRCLCPARSLRWHPILVYLQVYATGDHLRGPGNQQENARGSQGSRGLAQPLGQWADQAADGPAVAGFRAAACRGLG